MNDASTWPVSLQDVETARERIAPYLTPTPLRRYALLDEAVGNAISVWVKHENHQVTQSFKVRNGLSAVTPLGAEQRRRGVIAASRGNHGQGLAYAGMVLGVPAVICVPHGNSTVKNAAMRAMGAEVIETGNDYDGAAAAVDELVARRGLTLVHSTNNRDVIAGAATITLEMVEQRDDLDAIVVTVGGGSQAVGALTVVRALRPAIEVYGVQAARASAIHDGWHAGRPVRRDSAETIADGLATRACYDMTFAALRAGLRDFVTVSETAIAAAMRTMIETTHNLIEPAGAAGFAGLRVLGERLRGKNVAVIASGGNVDSDVLLAVLNGEIRD